jgi:hypothetical protein
MIEVIRTSETSAYHETTGRNIRQGSNLQIHLIPRLELRTVLKPLHDVVCLLRCDTMWTCMWIWYQRFWGTYRLHRLGLTPVTWLNEKCFFLIMSSVTMDTWSDRFFYGSKHCQTQCFSLSRLCWHHEQNVSLLCHSLRCFVLLSPTRSNRLPTSAEQVFSAPSTII